MQKTILLTGATDGIGLETAKTLVSMGHCVLLHGRSVTKLEKVTAMLSTLPGDGQVESYVADLADMGAVKNLAQAVAQNHTSLDVLINNAGVFQTPNSITQEGLDIRFVVNTLAPYVLTQRLLPLLGTSGRVVNLSSAAQASVNLEALAGRTRLSTNAAYAQSKLAMTMWSRTMALSLQDNGPMVVAVNPGSMLGTKMVKEAFGVSGGSIRIGADILVRASLSDEFQQASGKYFDNDSGRFAAPHPDALHPQKSEAVVRAIEAMVSE